MRSRFLSLMLGVLLAIGLAATAAAQSPAPAGALTDEQVKALQGVIHDYILNHPEVLIESLQTAGKRIEEEAEQTAETALAEHRDKLISDPQTPAGGNPGGDVTIVEFFDYRCPYCKQVEPEIRAMLKADPKLRIAYKEYPILGAESVFASRVALAARKQGKYQLFHDAMLAAKGKVDDTAILRIAQVAGLDVERVKADMQAPEIDAVIHRNIELAQLLQLRGTPGFVIGNEVVDGTASVETLKKYIDEARNKSG